MHSVYIIAPKTLCLVYMYPYIKLILQFKKNSIRDFMHDSFGWRHHGLDTTNTIVATPSLIPYYRFAIKRPTAIGDIRLTPNLEMHSIVYIRNS